MRPNKSFAKSVQNLRHALMSAACLASTTIPDAITPGSEFDKLGPKPFQNHWLKGVAEWLGESHEAFNAIQIAMGIPRGETRFLCASTGRCDRCEQEIKGLNDARLVATGQKEAASEKPTRKGRRASSPKRSA